MTMKYILKSYSCTLSLIKENKKLISNNIIGDPYLTTKKRSSLRSYCPEQGRGSGVGAGAPGAA